MGSLDERLLDAHLGQLDEAEGEAYRKALGDDPELATKHERLGRILRPLDAWSTPPPPGNLSERILERVAAYEANPPDESDSASATGEEVDFSRGPVFSFREILAAAAVIAFFAVVLVPSLSSVRAKSKQIACANNLRAIYQGVSGYAAANRNRLPYSPMPRGGSWLRVTRTNVPYTPNSKSRYLLIRLRFVKDPKVFVCPSRLDGKVMKLTDLSRLEDFADPQNCSYDSQNMAGPTPMLSAATAIPYMADANPLFDGGRFHKIDPVSANSLNHRKRSGQNVLYLDGKVDWCTTPNCGHQGDNIWQAGTITEYTGTEAQESPEDTFLVP